MAYRVYPMDTYFYNSIVRYPFEIRCEMAAELGFDATYLTCWSEEAWKDIAKLPTVKSKYGLDVAAVYATYDIAAGDDDTNNRRVIHLLESLEGCSTVELALKSAASGLAPSDPKGDDDVIRFLSKILPLCERKNIQLLLYPHIFFWLERIQDAVRICSKIQHPNLGCVFCGFHWYAVDGKMLQTSLALAEPLLRQVNLCGSRRDPNGVGGKATIEPLDDGELDNFALVGELRKLGYAGFIGFQGYSTGGDVYHKLKRSLTVFRDIEARLDRHPNWAVLP